MKTRRYIAFDTDNVKRLEEEQDKRKKYNMPYSAKAIINDLIREYL